MPTANRESAAGKDFLPGATEKPRGINTLSVPVTRIAGVFYFVPGSFVTCILTILHPASVLIRVIEYRM